MAIPMEFRTLLGRPPFYYQETAVVIIERLIEAFFLLDAGPAAWSGRIPCFSLPTI